MTPDEHAAILRDAVRRYVPGGGEQHLDALLELAKRGIQRRATVILFRASGKYYTEEEWRIPVEVKGEGSFTREALVPADMRHSPDFHRIDSGPILVVTQEPWGYPHIL